MGFGQIPMIPYTRTKKLWVSQLYSKQRDPTMNNLMRTMTGMALSQAVADSSHIAGHILDLV